MGYDAKLMLVRKPEDVGIFGDDEHRVVVYDDIINITDKLEDKRYGKIAFYGYEEEYFDNLKDYSIIRPVYYNIDRVLTTYIYEYTILKWYESIDAYHITDLLGAVYKDFKPNVYCYIPIDIARVVFKNLIPDTFNENTDAIFFYSD